MFYYMPLSFDQEIRNFLASFATVNTSYRSIVLTKNTALATIMKIRRMIQYISTIAVFSFKYILCLN
jgi:hypothetical protein